MSIFLRCWPDALRPSENSIQSHMVSYCSAIKSHFEDCLIIKLTLKTACNLAEYITSTHKQFTHYIRHSLTLRTVLQSICLSSLVSCTLNSNNTVSSISRPINRLLSANTSAVTDQVHVSLLRLNRPTARRLEPTSPVNLQIEQAQN